MKVTFDTDDFYGAIYAMMIEDVARSVAVRDDDVLKYVFDLKCGCDLHIDCTTRSGEGYEVTYSSCELAEFLDVDHCFWAHGEDGGDVLVCIE